jgi:[ribosomal protein S18]-alanine N-acetyltransferase
LKKELRPSFNAAIRPVRSQDLDAIEKIENDGYTGVDRYPRELLEGYLEASRENPDVVMLIAGDSAGYVLGEITGDDRHGEIIDLAVMKQHRGQGLGRDLLERVSESLRDKGAAEILLYVRTDNTAAIHLYETAGFEKTKDMPGYYQDGDGMQMTKRFKPVGPV